MNSRTCALLFLCAFVAVEARASYRSALPNGNYFKVCPRNNAFGQYFCNGAGNKWTKQYCQLDHDNDGFTNGEELGDPCCVWTQGGTPAYPQSAVTDPGSASSKPSEHTISTCSGAAGDPCKTNNGGCDSANGGCAANGTVVTCSCKTGYTLGTDKKTCTAVPAADPCKTSNGGCDSTNGVCTTSGSSATCSCKTGYQLATDKKTCTVVSDPCKTSNGGCDATNGKCTTSGGAATCSCNTGYQLGADKKTCTAVVGPDPCKTTNGGCDATNGICSLNDSGAASCSCKSGYQLGTDKKTCTVSNLCASNNGGCAAEATCRMSAGKATCTCRDGYEGSGTTCTKVDDTTEEPVNFCATDNGGCDLDHGLCVSGTRAASCSCEAGYTLQSDRKTCVQKSGGNTNPNTPANFCAVNNGGCAANAICTNGNNAAQCSCKTGFTGDGQTCNKNNAGTDTSGAGLDSQSQDTSSSSSPNMTTLLVIVGAVALVAFIGIGIFCRRRRDADRFSKVVNTMNAPLQTMPPTRPGYP